MIEAVARAICQASGQCKYIGRCNTGRCTVSPEVARAAIGVMRYPTEEMLAAGDSMMPQIAKGEDVTTGRDALAEAWPVMIDAALFPPPPSGEGGK